MEENPLTLLTEVQAQKMMDLFVSSGELCIRLETLEDGTKRTTYSSKNMNEWEVWVICEEIALSCRLKRLGGWKDDREEMDTLGLDKDIKLCVTYKPHRQDFGWMRKNISYQDAEIMAMTVSEMAKKIIFPDGSIK